MMPPTITLRVPSGPPRNLLWTVDQFHYLGDLGLFEGRRAMLIYGAILEEGSLNPLHRIALELATGALRRVFSSGWRVCVQMPLVLGQSTDPVPDLALIAGSARGSASHPSTAALIVEVSDSSLNYDTTTKAELYATAGIADYWVVDVNAQQLLVFRDPLPVAAGGVAYRTQLTLGANDSIATLASTSTVIRVKDLLP